MHDDVRPGQFYVAADRDGEMFLCCPGDGCAWEKGGLYGQEISELDTLSRLAEEHLKEVRNKA